MSAVSHHIAGMANTPEQTPAASGNAERDGDAGERKDGGRRHKSDPATGRRRSPLTDFLDAAEPLHPGAFAEAPQQPES